MLSAPLLPVLRPVLEAPARLGTPGGPDMTRYLLICSGLIVAIGLLGWALRRFLGSALRPGSSRRRNLQVLEMLPMGGKRSLALVRCQERDFLIGLGEQGIRLVAELDPPAAAPAAGDFETSLEQVLAEPARRPDRSRAASVLAALRRGEGVLG